MSKAKSIQQCHPYEMTVRSLQKGFCKAFSCRNCWNFQVQGSVVFRQYYPEGGWGLLVLLAALVTTVLTQGLVLGGQGPLGRGLLRLFRPSQLEASLLWVSAMTAVKFPHTFPAKVFYYAQFMTGGAFVRVVPRVASRHLFLPPEVQQEWQRPCKVAPRSYATLKRCANCAPIVDV